MVSKSPRSAKNTATGADKAHSDTLVTYEEEQNSLTEHIAELKSSMDTDIQELTAEIIREFTAPKAK